MTGDLRIACANLQYGGISTDGSQARLVKTLNALGEWQPHAVLVQELTGLPPGPLDNPSWDMPLADRDELLAGAAARAHDAARRHLSHIAGQLGMTPVLGPPVPGQWRRMHTAVLIRTGDGIEITETGPPPMAVPGAENPAWAQATMEITGIPHPVDVYSVHLPARSKLRQLWQAESLANVIAQRGQLALAAGDWNGIPRSDQPSGQDLADMNPHLRPARMMLAPGPLRPDYSVDDVMTRTGLVDIAASLPPARRTPAGLGPTGPAGSRVDRHYATVELTNAATGYRQIYAGGSDHAISMTSYDWTLLALAQPRGPRD